MTVLIDEINWDTPPRRPKMKALAPLAPGAVTITITCRVCGLRGAVEISVPARLCRECNADLPATRARAEAAQRAVAVKEVAASEAWTQYLESLPEELATRFDRVWSDRTAAETALRQEERRSGRGVDAAVQARRVAACRAALEQIKARIDRTRQNTANPLAAVLEAEAEYYRALEQTKEEAQRWQLALQEIDQAESGALPF